jgi:hypothetical protein
MKEWQLPKGTYYIRSRNSDIDSWSITDSGEYLLYLENYKAFKDLPAGVQGHLHGFEKELKARAAYQRGNCDWWRYTWPLHKEYYSRTKILSPYLARNNRFALDEDRKFLGLTDTTVLFKNDQPESMEYWLSLLNSKLLTWRFQSLAKLKSGGILEYFWNNISKLSVRRINFSASKDTLMHGSLSDNARKRIDIAKR